MARMPGAEWRPLAANWADQPYMSRFDQVVIHTMVGSLEGTDSYFRSGNGAGFAGTEAHFGTGYDGAIRQWQDTSRRADANGDGNHRIISIENADFGTGFPAWNINDGSQVPGFTAAQVESIARICAWANQTHGIPLVAAADSRSTTRGIGFHRLGVDPYRVSGGELWSSSYGKVCPGARRIAQIPQIITRAKQIVAGIEEDFMATMSDSEKAALMEVVNAFLPGKTGRTPGGGWSRVFDTDLNVKALLAREGVDTAEFIAAVRPLMIEAVQAGMAADNAEQADEIVDRLAARLGNA